MSGLDLDLLKTRPPGSPNNSNLLSTRPPGSPKHTVKSSSRKRKPKRAKSSIEQASSSDVNKKKKAKAGSFASQSRLEVEPEFYESLYNLPKTKDNGSILGRKRIRTPVSHGTNSGEETTKNQNNHSPNFPPSPKQRKPSPRFLEPLPPKRIICQEDPKAFRSFLKNFLRDDFGGLKLDLDLVQHSKDTGSSITDAVLQEVGDIHPGVEGLNLSGCSDITDIGVWSLARSCGNLRRLRLAGCSKITHVGLRSLAIRCGLLEEIDLTNCTRVGDIGLRVLAAGCWNLKELRVEGSSSITDGGVSEIARCCRKLEKISFRGCSKICEFGDRGLAEIGRNCQHLVELDLTGCVHVKDGGVRALTRGCKKLETLRLSGCSLLTGAAVRSLGKGCPNLTSLGLGGLKLLRNEDIWWLSEMLTNLRNLSLRGVVQLKESGVRGLCEQKKLEMLNLAGCYQVNNNALTLIGNALNTLRSLDVSGLHNIDREGVNALCHGCTRLVRLEAASCKKISKLVLESISEDLPFVQTAKDRVALIPEPGAYTMIRETEKMRRDTAAAVCIQKMFRGVRARGGAILIRYHALRRWVVPKFQSIVRGYLCRKRLRLAREKVERTRAALIVQKYYRGHKGRKKYRKAKRMKQLRENQTLAAICIQSVFRGWKARLRVAAIRRDLAMKALRESEARNREELMALRVQRSWRGKKGRVEYLARLEAKRLKEERIALEHRSAAKMQSIYRRRVAEKEAQRRRAEAILEARRQAAIRKMQCVFRGHKGRQIAEAARITALWQLQENSARKIQRAWRGCRGRHIAAILKSFARLKQHEVKAAIKIQGCWRARQGRLMYEFVKAARKQREKEEKASVQIQRVFRGYKGREEREVKRELLRNEEKVKPLREREKLLTKEYDIYKEKLDSKLEWVAKSEIKLDNMTVELIEVSKHKAKWYDSANVTGALQRYQTKYLAQALRVQIEELTALLKQEKKTTINDLEIEVRKVEYQLRQVRKQLAPTEANVAFYLRQNRGHDIRMKIRKDYNSAKLIQDTFREYRVRKAIRLGATNWVEIWDEELQLPRYKNTETGETVSRMPWEMRVIVEKYMDMSKKTEESKSKKLSSWVEDTDEASGYAYYYNVSTGECRWEPPTGRSFEPMRDQNSSSKVGDQDWLDENAQELTTRSTQKRKWNVWVEYEDNDGNIYYYNTETNESTWDRPEEFDKEWFETQDHAALTARSTQVRTTTQWVQYEDENGIVYYYNQSTGEATWEKPPNFDNNWLEENKESLTARSISTRSIKGEWEELLDPDSGYTYYWNSETNETRWSLSPGFEEETHTETNDHTEYGESGTSDEEQNCWVDYFDETTGTNYQWNSLTGETRWAESTEDDGIDSNQWINEQQQLNWFEEAEKEELISQSIVVDNEENNEWQELMDADTGNRYYWNQATNECVWEDPRRDNNLEGSTWDPTRFNPYIYESITQIYEDYYEQISFDPALQQNIATLLDLEANQADKTFELVEYQEYVSWIAEYVHTGELISAASASQYLIQKLAPSGEEGDPFQRQIEDDILGQE